MVETDTATAPQSNGPALTFTSRWLLPAAAFEPAFVFVIWKRRQLERLFMQDSSVEAEGSARTALYPPIIGYLDRFSARPGETLAGHVSLRRAGNYQVRLLRVISADANPQGPGIRYDDLSEIFHARLVGEHHETQLGSHGQLSIADTGMPSTWTAIIRPGLDGPEATVLSHEGKDGLLHLSLDRGHVTATLSGTTLPPVRLSLDAKLTVNRWYRVWASVLDETRELLVGAICLDPDGGREATARASIGGHRSPSGGVLMIGASEATKPRLHFDGRIEDPATLDRPLERWPDALATLDDLASSLIAGGDFSKGMSTASIFNAKTGAPDGTLVNTPTRAVRGARWTGRYMDWTLAPREYAAVHFHADDLDDCGWPAAFTFEVPTDLSSGCYCFHLASDDGEDWVPFFVLPAKSRRPAPIVLLIPTFTYQAYANHAYGGFDQSLRAIVKQRGAYPHHPDDHHDFGHSMYNRHPDGSGIAYSTRRRPILDMRPAFQTFDDGIGSGLRHYPADMHVVAWLTEKGHDFDVVTDEDLHTEGAELITPYSVLITATHPEYHSDRTLEALAAFKRAGRHLIYLGGNGFYWRVARHADSPHVIELRRAEGGTRIWAAEPGEYYHSSDGTYGGLWRRNGADPQRLVGVGFSAQGAFESTSYRRTAASYESELSWMFEGVDEVAIGATGLNAGGAVGYEVDRADIRLGTPLDTRIVATAAGLPPSFYPAMEEMLLPSHTVNGDAPDDLLRCDMVYFETGFGGSVFSVGSMTFAGALWNGGFTTSASTLLNNVVNRMKEASG